MSHSLPLNRAEQEILGNTRKILGNNLTGFLLSGLGEDRYTRQRTFTALLASPINHRITYQFDIINHGIQGLPTGRDPLVLASVLHQLWNQRKRSNGITFQAQILLDKLQWPNSPESNLIIQQAIERYFSTAYYLVDDDLPKSERIDGRYSHCRRLLIAYDTSTEHSLEKPNGGSPIMIVQFAADFIESISTNQKYFFGLDFGSLHSFQQIS